MRWIDGLVEYSLCDCYYETMYSKLQTSINLRHIDSNANIMGKFISTVE